MDSLSSVIRRPGGDADASMVSTGGMLCVYFAGLTWEIVKKRHISLAMSRGSTPTTSSTIGWKFMMAELGHTQLGLR